MNRYLAFAVLALACLSASNVHASNNLDVQFPSDEQETGYVREHDAVLAPFCISYRDYIIGSITGMKGNPLAPQLAELIYFEEPTSLSMNIQTVKDQLTQNPHLCDTIADYRYQLGAQLRDFKAKLSVEGKNVEDVSLERAECVTSFRIMMLYLSCSAVRGAEWSTNDSPYAKLAFDN